MVKSANIDPAKKSRVDLPVAGDVGRSVTANIGWYVVSIIMIGHHIVSIIHEIKLP